MGSINNTQRVAIAGQNDSDDEWEEPFKWCKSGTLSIYCTPNNFATSEDILLELGALTLPVFAAGLSLILILLYLLTTIYHKLFWKTVLFGKKDTNE